LKDLRNDYFKIRNECFFSFFPFSFFEEGELVTPVMDSISAITDAGEGEAFPAHSVSFCSLY